MMHSGYKIYIIEENGHMPDELEALLTRAGYVINYASTGLDRSGVGGTGYPALPSEPIPYSDLQGH